MLNKFRYTAYVTILSIVFFGSVVNAKSTPMSIATGVDPSFAAFYLGKTEGIFDNYDLEVDLRTGSSGSAMVAFLVNNGVQAAFGAEQAGMLNHLLDENVVVVAEGTEVNELYGVVAKDVGSFEDLKGRKVGIARGTGSEVFWNEAINHLKLDKNDYQIVQVEAPEMVAALERGDIDAFSVWEPWVTRATDSIDGANKVLNQEGILDSRVFVYMNKEWAEEHPEAAAGFMQALIDASDLINEKPEYAVEQVANFLKLDRDLTGKLMEQYSYGIKLTDASIDNLKLVTQQLKDDNKLKEDIDWSSFIYTKPLLKAAPDSVTYQN